MVKFFWDADTDELLGYQVLYCWSTGGGDGSCSPDALRCPGGGGGGGGGWTPPDPEPCDVGDPNIDGEAAASFLSSLWANSNPGTVEFRTPIDERREQGAWIVKGSDGTISYVPFPESWPSTACGIGAPDGWEDSIPPGTVGYMHTHPFYAGEGTREVCGMEYGDESYSSGFGSDDRMFLLLLSAATSPPVMGYVIDGAGGITPFSVTDAVSGSNEANSVGICGFSILKL
jgi:hypothetical protein